MTVKNLFFALLLVIPQLAWSATRTINTDWGQWSTASTWASSTMPVNGDLVEGKNSGGTLNTVVDGAINLSLIGINFPKTSNLVLYSGANLTINGNIVGSSGLTIEVQNGATLTVNGNISSSGALVITNSGTLNVTGTVSGTSGVTITNNSNNGLTIGGTISSSNGPISVTQNNSSNMSLGALSAKNNVTITKNGTGTMTFNGSVSSTSGNIAITGNSGTLNITGSVTGSNDVDIVSNGGSVVHIYGGVTAGNNASFTANDDLYIDGVVTVNNNATFTGNGGGAFELGGIAGGNNTSLTFNGDASITGDVSLGQGTSLTVNSGTLVVEGDFTSGGGSTNYVVHSEMIVGGTLSLDNGNDNITGYGTVTTGGTCNYNTGGSGTITQNCSVTKPIALPVSLLNFEGTSTSFGNELNWQTASELNNDFFTVEKSRDGVNFETIEQIDGGGNSNEILSYSYVDINVSAVDYYRLSQTDYDGTVKKLAVLRLGSETKREIKIYPNPAESGQPIQISGTSTAAFWKLLSLSGQEVKSGDLVDGTSVDVSGQLPGIYFLEIKDGEQVNRQKLILK